MTPDHGDGPVRHGGGDGGLHSVGAAELPYGGETQDSQSPGFRFCRDDRNDTGRGDRCGDATWRAYLSQAPGGSLPQVNARDRIGQGPWYNAKGVMIAADLICSVFFPSSLSLSSIVKYFLSE